MRCRFCRKRYRFDPAGSLFCCSTPRIDWSGRFRRSHPRRPRTCPRNLAYSRCSFQRCRSCLWRYSRRSLRPLNRRRCRHRHFCRRARRSSRRSHSVRSCYRSHRAPRGIFPRTPVCSRYRFPFRSCYRVRQSNWRTERRLCRTQSRRFRASTESHCSSLGSRLPGTFRRSRRRRHRTCPCSLACRRSSRCAWRRCRYLTWRRNRHKPPPLFPHASLASPARQLLARQQPFWQLAGLQPVCAGTHSPCWQILPVSHSIQVLPTLPQALGDSPGAQTVLLRQQPLQLSGVQVAPLSEPGVCSTPEQAATKSAMAKHVSSGLFMVLFPGVVVAEGRWSTRRPRYLHRAPYRHRLRCRCARAA
jgi:hypothetical protein